jgi:hypothetical protein
VTSTFLPGTSANRTWNEDDAFYDPGPPPKPAKFHPLKKASRFDDFQTPPAALEPIADYLGKWAMGTPGFWFWEPAAGEGLLAGAIRDQLGYLNGGAFSIRESDILPEIDNTLRWRDCQDFLARKTPVAGPDQSCFVITNPPFTLKDQFLKHCYTLANAGFIEGFALLMPLTALEGLKRQSLYRDHGIEIVIPDRRINYHTPSGEGAGAWFASGWYSYGLGIGNSLTFWKSYPGWCAAPGKSKKARKKAKLAS